MSNRPRLSPESALIFAAIFGVFFWWSVFRPVHGLLTGGPHG